MEHVRGDFLLCSVFSPIADMTSIALHKAVDRGHLAVMDTVLEADSDLGEKDGMGRTAEDICREKGMPYSVLTRLAVTL